MAPFIRKKLALTSPTSSGRSAGIVRSRTQATEFSFLVLQRNLENTFDVSEEPFTVNIAVFSTLPLISDHTLKRLQ
jgi:hypothetical protein